MSRSRAIPLSFLALVALVAPLGAQSAGLAETLREKERAAAEDPDALVEVAMWARSRGLANEARRLLEAAVAADPNHAAAHEALGHVRVDGEWLSAEEATRRIAEQRQAEYEAKGYELVDGVWVAPERIDDARRGIFHHDGERVSLAEMRRLQAGQVRHPRTGMLIDATHREKAEAGRFPIRGGRWVDLEEANAFHADPSRPWVFRTDDATLISTLPLETLEGEQVAPIVDEVVRTLSPLFGGEPIHPRYRPVVLIAATTDEYVGLGNDIGSEGSAYGAFLADAQVGIDGLRPPVRPGVANFGEESWGVYYVRHATALAVLAARLASIDASAPVWFERAVGGYAERLFSPGVAQWFGQQHIAKGGVADLEQWFRTFTISGDLSPEQLGANVYQAGLLLHFCLYGGDAAATAALQKVTAAYTGGDAEAWRRAIAGLRDRLIAREEALQSHLQKITR